MATIIRADSRKRVFPSSSSEHSPQPKRRRTTDTRSPSVPYANIAPSSAMTRSNPVARPVIVAHSTDDISTRLDSAIQRSWGQKVQQYTKVHVLLFFWEDDDILVSNDVAALEETFRVLYGYETTVDKIKAPKANQELLRGVLDFLQANDSPDHLLIVYYVGDCEPNLKAGEAPLWVPHRQNGLARISGLAVQSGQVQAHLEDADADVLMLWDCSLGPRTAGRYSQSSGRSSVSEVLTAGVYNTVASKVGEATYTRALIDELPKAAKSGPVRIIDLHAQLLNRLGAKRPIALNFVYRAPSHGWLSQVQRSIVLAPLGLNRNGSDATRGESRSQARKPVNSEEVADEMDNEPNGDVVKGSSVTVCFRISETDATQANLESWLSEAPRHGRDVIKIKGQFAGYSPMISLTIPLDIWAILPECPARGLKAFATTGIADLEVEEAIEQALFDKMEHEEPIADNLMQDDHHSEVVHKVEEDAVLDDGYALRNSPKKIRKALPTGRRLLPSEPRTLLPSERQELSASPQVQHQVQPAALNAPAGHSPVAATERKALPTSRKPVKISIKSAGPLLACPDCVGTHFRDDESLAAHKRKHHTRPFQCVFNWAGCTSDFASKNEWKRHVMSQHILLNFWLCQLDSCRNTVNGPKTAGGANLPNGSIFNRKDLYTQHLRRMHTPPAIKKQLKAAKAAKAAPSAEMVQFDEHLKDLQKAGYQQRCELPQYMRCPAVGCNHEFQGANAWDDRMEHVAKHLEKAAAGKEQQVTFGGDWDPTLTAWATKPDVGIVFGYDGQWKLVESPLKASRSTAPNVVLPADDHADAVHGNGNHNDGSPDEDDEDRDRERSRSVIEVAEGQHNDHDDDMEY